MSQKKIFKVEGMSCSHCERAVETAVKNIKGVSSVKASAPKARAEVSIDEAVTSQAIITAIAEAGFTAEESADEDGEPHPRRILHIIPAAGAAALLFMFIWHGGLTTLPSIPVNASLGLVFIAGIFTSLHCAAMCGGINLSQCIQGAGKCAERFSGIMPSSLYNGGRVVSYTITGAIAGFLGSAFDFSDSAKSGIMIGAGIVMAIMGLRLLGIFDILPKIPLPGFMMRIGKIRDGRYTPLAIGLLSGLMPCGPLQGMQIFALGTGNAIYGALSMLVFALGTVPLMFSLGAASTLISRRFTSVMLKFGGAFVLILSLIMISNGLSLSGTELLAKSEGYAISTVNAREQTVTSDISSHSYQPITVKQGIHVKWTIRARAADLNGCNSAIVIPEYKIKKRLVPGDNLIIFTPEKSGLVTFTCWMGMIRSSIRVTQ
jgi:uncharacterized protein